MDEFTGLSRSHQRKICSLPHFVAEEIEAYSPQRASEQRSEPDPSVSNAHTLSFSFTTMIAQCHTDPPASAEPLLTPLVSCSEPPPVLLRGLLRWLHEPWAWSLRPQNWARGGQKRPSPAPVSSSKSHRSCRKMGRQDVRGYPFCTLPYPQPVLTCSWALRLRSISSRRVGNSRPEGQAQPSCAPGGRLESGPMESLPAWRQGLASLTCRSAARRWPRPAGHQKRCLYRAKACLGLQGSPSSPGVAACAMGKGAGA